MQGGWGSLVWPPPSTPNRPHFLSLPSGLDCFQSSRGQSHTEPPAAPTRAGVHGASEWARGGGSPHEAWLNGYAQATQWGPGGRGWCGGHGRDPPAHFTSCRPLPPTAPSTFTAHHPTWHACSPGDVMATTMMIMLETKHDGDLRTRGRTHAHPWGPVPSTWRGARRG